MSVASRLQLPRLVVPLAVLLGLAQAWLTRSFANNDGPSFLDLGEAVASHGWSAAVNGLYSPLYPVLIGLTLAVIQPVPAAEFAAVHGLNFLLYLGNLAAFYYLVRSLLTVRANLGAGPPPDTRRFDDLLDALGFGLCTWASLKLIGVAQIIPDLAVSPFVDLTAGLLVRLGSGSYTRATFVLLGFASGWGTWPKP